MVVSGGPYLFLLLVLFGGPIWGSRWDVLNSQLSKIIFYYPIPSGIKARLKYCNRCNVSKGGGGKDILRYTLMYVMNITKTYFNRKGFDSPDDVNIVSLRSLTKRSDSFISKRKAVQSTRTLVLC